MLESLYGKSNVPLKSALSTVEPHRSEHQTTELTG